METDAAGEFVLSADGARIPLVAAGAELTPEVQARCARRACARPGQGVRRRALAARLLFGLAVIGLVAGSVLLKAGSGAGAAPPAGG